MERGHTALAGGVLLGILAKLPMVILDALLNLVPVIGSDSLGGDL